MDDFFVALERQVWAIWLPVVASAALALGRIMSKVGHHRVSLESTKLVLGKPMHKYADYFETCRRKRNTAGSRRTARACARDTASPFRR